VEWASKPIFAFWQVQYVRRAVEIADGLTIPGLSPECVQYVKTHPSNACDVQVMEVFAQGLVSAGWKVKAAAVYGTLLTVRVQLKCS
jgi:hypothetical protein